MPLVGKVRMLKSLNPEGKGRNGGTSYLLNGRHSTGHWPTHRAWIAQGPSMHPSIQAPWRIVETWVSKVHMTFSGQVSQTLTSCLLTDTSDTGSKPRPSGPQHCSCSRICVTTGPSRHASPHSHSVLGTDLVSQVWSSLRPLCTQVFIPNLHVER